MEKMECSPGTNLVFVSLHPGNLPRLLRQHVDFGSMSRQNLKDLLDLVDRLGTRVLEIKRTGGTVEPQKRGGQMDKKHTLEIIEIP